MNSFFFFFSSRRRHTRCYRDWSSDVCSSDLPSQKREARKKIVQALKTLNWTGKTRCVRINDLTTEYAFEDIIEVVEGAGEHLDTIMMTKVMTPADVLFADKLLHQLEKKLKLKRSIGLE